MLPATSTLISSLAFPAFGNRAVLIQGIHGGYGDSDNSSRGLSNATDLRWMLTTRAVADAVVVGYQTAVRENYRRISLSPELMTERKKLGLTGMPKLVVFTRNGEAVAAAHEFADVVINTAEISLTDALAQLNESGLVRLSIEGGPRLINAMAEEGLIHQLALTTSTVESSQKDSLSALDALIAKSAHTIFEEDGFTFALHGELPTWKETLDPLAYDVLRRSATQAPFSVPYEKTPAPGYYVCRGCGNRLFDADTQFDAHCGWPAFWKPASDDGVKLVEDRSLFMKRVEVRCAACDGHLGHVFHGEGFGHPTDDRYCINAIALIRKN
ncbi:MAG: peptide-methionine (R)-S-oxide reductase [Actinomycetota bacterium]